MSAECVADAAKTILILTDTVTIDKCVTIETCSALIAAVAGHAVGKTGAARRQLIRCTGSIDQIVVLVAEDAHAGLVAVRAVGDRAGQLGAHRLSSLVGVQKEGAKIAGRAFEYHIAIDCRLPSDLILDAVVDVVGGRRAALC